MKFSTYKKLRWDNCVVGYHYIHHTANVINNMNLRKRFRKKRDRKNYRKLYNANGQMLNVYLVNHIAFWGGF